MRLTERIRGWARRIKRDAVTLWFAYKHPGTPMLAKALCVLVVAYRWFVELGRNGRKTMNRPGRIDRLT